MDKALSAENMVDEKRSSNSWARGLAVDWGVSGL